MAGIIKKEMNFTLIPPILEADFEKNVLDSYSLGWLDLHHIALLSENYCVYAYSFEETGHPFELSDDPTKPHEFYADIIDKSFNELMSDVYQVLDYHLIFHAWNDVSDIDRYDKLLGVKHCPVKVVW